MFCIFHCRYKTLIIMPALHMLRRFFRGTQPKTAAATDHDPQKILEHWEPDTLSLLPSFFWKRDSSVTVTVKEVEQHESHVYISLLFDTRIPLYQEPESESDDSYCIDAQRLFYTAVMAERAPRSEDEYIQLADVGWSQIEVFVFQWSYRCSKTPSGDTVFVPRNVFIEQKPYIYE